MWVSSVKMRGSSESLWKMSVMKKLYMDFKFFFVQKNRHLLIPFSQRFFEVPLYFHIVVQPVSRIFLSCKIATLHIRYSYSFPLHPPSPWQWLFDHSRSPTKVESCHPVVLSYLQVPHQWIQATADRKYLIKSWVCTDFMQVFPYFSHDDYLWNS